MKQFHPLLILAFIASILLFVVSLKYHEEMKHSILIEQNQKLEKMAQKILSLKKIWQNSSFQEKKIQNFLKNISARHINFTKHSSYDFLDLKFDKITLATSKYILNTLINQNIKILTLDINKIDNSSLSIKIRIAK